MYVTPLTVGNAGIVGVATEVRVVEIAGVEVRSIVGTLIGVGTRAVGVPRVGLFAKVEVRSIVGTLIGVGTRAVGVPRVGLFAKVEVRIIVGVLDAVGAEGATLTWVDVPAVGCAVSEDVGVGAGAHPSTVLRTSAVSTRSRVRPNVKEYFFMRFSFSFRLFDIHFE